MRWKMAQIMTCCMFVRSGLVVKFVRSRLVVRMTFRSKKVLTVFSSSGCEGSQENGLEAGLVGSCQKGTSERSELEKLVNRGCPVFCNCSRCFQEGVAFSRHVSDACGLSLGDM